MEPESEKLLRFIILPIGLNVLVSVVMALVGLKYYQFFGDHFSVLITVFYAIILFVFSSFLKEASVKESIFRILLVTIIYALVPADLDQIFIPRSDVRTLSIFIKDFLHPVGIWVLAIAFTLYLFIKSKLRT